ncbi:hypothetical protein D3C84_1045110 [compost metagenome]
MFPVGRFRGDALDEHLQDSPAGQRNARPLGSRWVAITYQGDGIDEGARLEAFEKVFLDATTRKGTDVRPVATCGQHGTRFAG